MLLCWEEKANQTQDERTARCNGNLLCRLRFLIFYLIGHHTIKMSKSNQSVHGFWICTVSFATSLKVVLCTVTLKRRLQTVQTVQTVQTEYLFSYLNKSTYNPDIADDRWPQLISSTLSSPVFVYFFSNSRQLSVCFSYGSSIPAKIHGLYLKFTRAWSLE